MSRTVVLSSPELVRQLHDHFEACYPAEGCALLGGVVRDGLVTVDHIALAENRSDRQNRRFEIDPPWLMKIERQWDESGVQLVGIAHSHPDCPEIPSETDRSFALLWGEWVWLISRVDQGSATGMRAWTIVDERFTECAVEVST